ncbi:MAG: M15 family metallopeptidase [Candidatus Limnocylindrales bacterium]
MPRPSAGKPRLIALLLLVALASGLAVTASASAALPSCKVADTLTKHRSYADWNRSILDLRYRLSSTYKPSDLRSTSYAALNGGHTVRRLVVADLRAMASAARSAGARFSVQSAFRSYATQKSTFSYWVRTLGYTTAVRTSARAGHSEHQLGTTVDLRSYGGSAPWYHRDWATTRAGTWLKANAWKYGFIMSYPKGKTTVTCYAYEPWHYRYIGRARAAKVKSSGLTLREFLWREQSAPTPTPTPTPPTPPPTTPTPTAAPTATPAPTGTPRPQPTATASPTPTPTPTATPAPAAPAVESAPTPTSEPSTPT